MFLHWDLIFRYKIRGLPKKGYTRIVTTGPFVVQNRSRGTLLGSNVRLADTPHSRRVGLLKHEGLEQGEGLWIFPTQAIHTFGMKFPIDVVFLDSSLLVKRVYQALPPSRLTRFVWRAKSVLELPSGSLKSTGTMVGDQLQFSPCEGAME
jgi:uncharacterized membrane protein (UPF0127 family)